MSKEIKRKPIIGILPSVEPTNKMTKVNYGYTNGIIKQIFSRWLICVTHFSL